MNPMTDMFDFNKNMEQFSKFDAGLRQRGPMKAFTDMQAKYRAVAIEALNKNVELTTAWMTRRRERRDDAHDRRKPSRPPTPRKPANWPRPRCRTSRPACWPTLKSRRKPRPSCSTPSSLPTPKAVEEAAGRTKAAIKPPPRKPRKPQSTNRNIRARIGRIRPPVPIFLFRIRVKLQSRSASGTCSLRCRVHLPVRPKPS